MTHRKIMLAYSKDGGHTWSNWKLRDIGALGQYSKRVVFGPLGAGNSFTFKIKLTSACPVDVLAGSAAVETRE